VARNVSRSLTTPYPPNQEPAITTSSTRTHKTWSTSKGASITGQAVAARDHLGALFSVFGIVRCYALRTE
jgi:hypothetical protein